jgi:hypothetical protein
MEKIQEQCLPGGLTVIPELGIFHSNIVISRITNPDLGLFQRMCISRQAPLL